MQFIGKERVVVMGARGNLRGGSCPCGLQGQRWRQQHHRFDACPNARRSLQDDVPCPEGTRARLYLCAPVPSTPAGLGWAHVHKSASKVRQGRNGFFYKRVPFRDLSCPTTTTGLVRWDFHQHKARTPREEDRSGCSRVENARRRLANEQHCTTAQ